MASTGPLDTRLAEADFLLELLDRLPDVVFFVKDAAGRYRSVNQTLVARLGLGSKADVIGRTAGDLFPSTLGQRYLAQDLGVCRDGREIANLLELHLYPSHREGWCLTTKLPIRDPANEIVGLAGISRDVHVPVRAGRSLGGLASTLRFIQDHPAEPLRVTRLAAMAGVSADQFTRRLRALLGITPAQLVIQTRIDEARRLLREGRRPISEIAQRTGYCDQSAFTRQFRATVGLTPAQYRAKARGDRTGD
jgi:AraC-like DNA-binding protein